MKKDQIPLNYSVLVADHPVIMPVEVTGIYTVLTRQCDENYYFPGELHDPWELVYVISGEAGITADDRFYQAKPGCLVIHKPLELHKIRSLSPDTSFLVISFDLRGNMTERLQNQVFELDVSQKFLFSRILSLLEKIDAPERDTNARFYHLVWDEYPQTFCQLASLLNTALVILIQNEQDVTQPMRSGLFSDIVRLLESRVSGTITIEEVADTCHVATSTVKKSFAKYAGCGIHKYFLRLKLRHAVELLRKGESVSSVSDRLGFNNPNYFSCVFRRELGHSPSHYR